MATDEKPLPFICTLLGSLSLEIRRKIYGMVFEGSEWSVGPHGLGDAPPAFMLEHKHRSSDKPRTLFVTKPGSQVFLQRKIENDRRAILWTCQQLYIEAREIYTQHTQFFFLNLAALENFSPFMRHFIKDLCIPGRTVICKSSSLRLFRVLSTMKGLKVLTFTGKIYEHMFQISCPLRNLRGLEELRLDETGGWRPYRLLKPAHMPSPTYAGRLRGEGGNGNENHSLFRETAAKHDADDLEVAQGKL